MLGSSSFKDKRKENSGVFTTGRMEGVMQIRKKNYQFQNKVN